jgi:DMSO/TMAO reductase YedYZ molybdopterin-dependent catalytic subunit
MLPPGQRERKDLPRFGLPRFAEPPPVTPASPTLRVGGDVEQPVTIALEELSGLRRIDQVSDLHCVTTWSVCGLHWHGYTFAAFAAWMVPRVIPDPDAAWVAFVGADGYRSFLPLDLAKSPDVLLADMLDGTPLPPAHGYPLRVVAPAHYGYKSVKHVKEILFLRKRPRSVAGIFEHPVGRVASEERVRVIPVRVFRILIRPVVPFLVSMYRRTSALV